jgi:transketolase
MRNSFISCLVQLNREGGNAFLLVGDLGYSVVEEFQEKYPDHFINVGVAEQNMAGIAAGIASEGFQVFCYSIGNFNTFRCAEQIRNDIDYHNLPVCTVSVGGGVAYGNMGYSHHAIQDMALMRTMPNTTIYAPVDGNETISCFNELVSRKTPSYLRLHKSGERLITKPGTKIEPGIPRYVAGNPTSRRILLTSGFCGQGAFDYVQINSESCHYALPAWGLKHKDYLSAFLDQYDEIIVIEDHLLDGGFCSWILESQIGKANILKIKSKALLTKTIGLVGSEQYLHAASQLFEL